MDKDVLQETSLRYFLEVIRTGSISEAANRLDVAPSAVSRHIARLEKGLDTLLFERKARGMVPNAAGKMLATYAKRTAYDADRIVEEILSLRGLKQGLVRVVCSLGFGVDFVPSLIVDFRKRYDGIRFTVDVCPQGKIPELIRNGDADIGVTLSLTSQREIKVEIREPAPIMAIMSPTHTLATERELSLAQAIAHPIALQHTESTTRQLIEISLSRQQLACEPVFISRNYEAIIGFAKAGGGLSFCGELAVRGLIQRSELVAIPLTDREMSERHFEVQTLAGRSQSIACRAFIEAIAHEVSRR